MASTGKICENCKRSEELDHGVKLQRCTRCKKTFYCSRQCQREDYKKHKLTCVKEEEEKKIQKKEKKFFSLGDVLERNPTLTHPPTAALHMMLSWRPLPELPLVLGDKENPNPAEHIRAHFAANDSEDAAKSFGESVIRAMKQAEPLLLKPLSTCLGCRLSTGPVGTVPCGERHRTCLRIQACILTLGVLRRHSHRLNVCVGLLQGGDFFQTCLRWIQVTTEADRPYFAILASNLMATVCSQLTIEQLRKYISPQLAIKVSGRDSNTFGEMLYSKVSSGCVAEEMFGVAALANMCGWLFPFVEIGLQVDRNFILVVWSLFINM